MLALWGLVLSMMFVCAAWAVSPPECLGVVLLGAAGWFAACAVVAATWDADDTLRRIARRMDTEDHDRCD